jgi:tetratricopeptide (TPR) repeat protein
VIIRVVAILLVAILSYANSIDAPFVFDDHVLVESSDYVHGPDPWVAFRIGFWEHTGRGAAEGTNYYRPLQQLTYALDQRLGDGSPIAFHASNVAWHLLACLLVYFLGRALFRDEGPVFLATLLFAVHPIHTEAVSWIASRGDTMTTAGCCAALLAFIHGLAAPRPGKRATLLALAALFWLGALLSKENALTFPAVVALWILMAGRAAMRPSGPRPWQAFTAVFIPTLGVYFLLRFGLAQVPFPTPSEPHPLADGVLHGAEVLARYLGMLVNPWPPNLFRGEVLSQQPSPVGWLCLAIVVALAGLTVVACRRAPSLGFCLGWVLITFVPALDLVRVPMPLAERSAYLPSVGFCWLVALLAARLRKPACWALMGALVVLGGALTLLRNVDYSDEIALWRQTARVAPHTLEAREALGALYGREGAWKASEAEYETLVKAAPDYETTWIGLAAALTGQGRSDEAIAVLRQGLAHGVHRPARLEYEIGRCEEDRRDDRAAERAFLRAARLDPAYGEPLFALGVLYGREKRWDEAVDVLGRLLALDPRNSRAAHNFLVALLEAGKAAQARGDRAAAAGRYRQFLEAWNGDPAVRAEVERRLAEVSGTR